MPTCWTGSGEQRSARAWFDAEKSLILGLTNGLRSRMRSAPTRHARMQSPALDALVVAPVTVLLYHVCMTLTNNLKQTGETSYARRAGESSADGSVIDGRPTAEGAVAQAWSRCVWPACSPYHSHSHRSACPCSIKFKLEISRREARGQHSADESSTERGESGILQSAPVVVGSPHASPTASSPCNFRSWVCSRGEVHACTRRRKPPPGAMASL